VSFIDSVNESTVKHHSMKMSSGHGGKAVRVLSVGTKWEWASLFTIREMNLSMPWD
jgi:hypothetical protein